ncbi:MAG: YvrJ family protein [Bacillaceae bacterium]
MAELVGFIGDVGFPIMITLYLLHRIEQKLDAVVLSIERVQASVENSNEACRLPQYHK